MTGSMRRASAPGWVAGASLAVLVSVALLPLISSPTAGLPIGVGGTVDGGGAPGPVSSASRTLEPTALVTPAALGAPAAPTVSATALDVDQALTVTGTIPTSGTAPYSWTWLLSVDGAAYADTTQCGTNSGSGAAGGAPVSCAIAGGTLMVGDTYAFELEVTDSTPATATSPASPTVTVAAALTAGPVTPGSPTIDDGQTVTLTENRAGGSLPHSYEWYSSATGGGLSCSSGTAVGAGRTLGATPATSTYYCYVVTDSASKPESASSAWDLVTVDPALTAPGVPAVSALKLDVDQTLTVTDAISSTGTSPYAWTWLVSLNGGAYHAATQCAADAGTGAVAGAVETCTIDGGTLTAGESYAAELQVTDGASTPETKVSGSSPSVAVGTALTAPGAPGVSATLVNVSEILTVTGTIPSTGTSPYSWTWLVSEDGDAYGPTTDCAADTGTGALAGATEVCSIASGSLTGGDTYAFELEVTDGASMPETQVSAASATVTASWGLTPPGAPGVSATSLDANQALSVTGTIPTTGVPPYSWTWLLSVNGGPYGGANQCAVNNGTGALAGAKETCSIAIGTLTVTDSYAFELKVAVGSGPGEESATSPASSAVMVNSALSAGAVAPSSPTIDRGQTVTLTANPSGGTAPYSYQWYSGATSESCSSPVGSDSATYVASPTTSTYYCYVVTDNASSPAEATSAAALVTASSTLTASSGLPAWVWSAAGVGIAAGVLAALLLIVPARRRRRAPAAAAGGLPPAGNAGDGLAAHGSGRLAAAAAALLPSGPAVIGEGAPASFMPSPEGTKAFQPDPTELPAPAQPAAEGSPAIPETTLLAAQEIGGQGPAEASPAAAGVAPLGSEEAKAEGLPPALVPAAEDRAVPSDAPEIGASGPATPLTFPTPAESPALESSVAEEGPPVASVFPAEPEASPLDSREISEQGPPTFATFPLEAPPVATGSRETGEPSASEASVSPAEAEVAALAGEGVVGESRPPEVVSSTEPAAIPPDSQKMEGESPPVVAAPPAQPEADPLASHEVGEQGSAAAAASAAEPAALPLGSEDVGKESALRLAGSPAEAPTVALVATEVEEQGSPQAPVLPAEAERLHPNALEVQESIPAPVTAPSPEAGGAVGAAVDSTELMAELDKISEDRLKAAIAELLKKGAAKNPVQWASEEAKTEGPT